MQGLFYANNLKTPRQTSIMPDILLGCFSVFVSFEFASFAPMATVAKCIKANTKGIQSWVWPSRQIERFAMQASVPTAKPSDSPSQKVSVFGRSCGFLKKFIIPTATKKSEPMVFSAVPNSSLAIIAMQVVKKQSKRVATATINENSHTFFVFKPMANPATVLSILTAKAVKIKNIKKFIKNPVCVCFIL